MQFSLSFINFLVINHKTACATMTVQAKTSLAHTSKFATSVLYNFGWERLTKFTSMGSVEFTLKFEFCVAIPKDFIGPKLGKIKRVN